MATTSSLFAPGIRALTHFQNENAMFSTPRVPVSLEFFPPKTGEGADKLRLVRQQLSVLQARFCSVTYGAGGSTQEGSLRTVAELAKEGERAAAHFTCIHATKESVRVHLQTLHSMGVRHLVALRGDLPDDYVPGDFPYASDLVAFVRRETGKDFHIEVACYPETHPQAASPQDDVKAYATKVRAGADSAITQYFYNADAYFRFVEETSALGLDIDVVPGILPIANTGQLLRFSQACGAEIPRWIRQRLEGFGQDMVSVQAFGLEVVARLCERLLAGGAPGLHFYTLNQSAPTLAICRELGLSGGIAPVPNSRVG
jgi:methylenetetrahydrofolate reductase (NADPH)